VRVYEQLTHLKVWARKRHVIHVLYQLYTAEIEYAAGHLLHISKVHAGQVQKSCFFYFKYGIWMNTFCQSMLHVCPQLDVRFLADSNNWNVNATPNLRTVRQMLRALSNVRV